jgi:glutamate N-acetyltransferase/amino-acid N-acetyltransferase
VSVTAAAGFTAAGVHAGVKAGGSLDLAVVAADRAVPAAAVFTTNIAAAPPVVLSRRHLAEGATVRAVVLNSGCANAATGAAGDAAARAMADTLAGRLGERPEQILVASTGPIGTHLPVDTVIGGIGAAVERLGSTPEAGTAAATAIMTTDSVPKQSTASGGGIVVGGMAKGAGMVRPDMATLLAVVTTDAVVEAGRLDAVLRRAVDGSFHSLNVDGCASTNDTVVVMASGASGIAADGLFDEMLGRVCRDLAHQLAADAEGASRVVTIAVEGAADDASARRAGRLVADSALVRAAFYGGDPNWGRLVGALGAGDVAFDPSAVTIAFGDVVVAKDGVAAPYPEAELLEALAVGDFTVRLAIGSGPGSAAVLTTDLTPDYVRFNGERS